jgi:hypothetical protein
MPEPTSILDVLLTESHPDAGVKAQEELEAAGVRVHRCHEPGSDGFPCSALAGPGCPLEEGVDAVVVVRKNAATHPTALEGGVTCGLRAGVPVVSFGPALLDPFNRWVSVRAGDDLAESCRWAVDGWVGDLRRDTADRCTSLLATMGCEPGDLELQAQRSGRDLLLRVTLPVEVPAAARESIAVRVLDAVRATGRTFERMDVSVDGNPG